MHKDHVGDPLCFQCDRPWCEKCKTCHWCEGLASHPPKDVVRELDWNPELWENAQHA
jgi:hypothetical protein